MKTTTTYVSTNSRRCANCWQRPGRCLDSCPDNPNATQRMTLTDNTRLDGLSMTGVMRTLSNQPQSHAEGRSWRRPVPVRYVVAIWLGLALIGVGLAREPISLLIWGWLHA